jgi:IS5 family transposase
LTKNKDGKRDHEMRQTKKRNQYYFGMKAHIGADVESGLVHYVHGTAANVANVPQVAQLLARRTRSTQTRAIPGARSAVSMLTVRLSVDRGTQR